MSDMVRFANCLINKGEYGGERILSKETAELMWEPHYFAHEDFKDHYYMGFDFFIYNMNGIRVIEHTGGIGGFTSVFTILPDLNMAFIIVANLHEALKKRVTRKIRNRFLKLLTNIPTEADDFIDYSLIPEKKYWPMIKGYYTSYPGWLSSTRVYLEGGDFKIMEKNNSLWLSTFYGERKGGVKLYPTKSPLVYQYKQESDAGDIFPTTRVGFTLNGEGTKAIEMAIHYTKLQKVSFSQTMRFKVYSWIVLLLIVILLIVLL